MTNLQITLLSASIIVLIIVLWNIIKNHMNISYAMIWILWSIGMVIISVFPNIIEKVKNVLGIQTQSNAVFLITIFLLYCLTFYLYLRISRHNEDIVKLNYDISSLKKKLEDIENSKKN